MRFDAELLLLAMAPVFLTCIGWEARHLRRARPHAQIYKRADTLCNASLALMHQAADKLRALFGPPEWATALHAARDAHAGSSAQDPRLCEPETLAFPASRKT